jgi:hypothetical protein
MGQHRPDWDYLPRAQFLGLRRVFFFGGSWESSAVIAANHFGGLPRSEGVLGKHSEMSEGFFNGCLLFWRARNHSLSPTTAVERVCYAYHEQLYARTARTELARNRKEA